MLKQQKKKLLSYNFVCVFIWLNGTDSVFQKRAKYKLNIDKKLSLLDTVAKSIY
jgi:hypothetical protein